MKGYYLFKLTIGSLILISGCMGGPKSPSFINLDDVKIVTANASRVVLQGDASLITQMLLQANSPKQTFILR